MADLSEQLRARLGTTTNEPAPGSQLARSPAPDSFADDNNHFALAMYSRVRRSDRNVFFSPFSIRTALGMVYAGARGETAQQMRDALRYPDDGPSARDAIGRVIEELNAFGRGRTEFMVANSLWGQQGETVLAEFLELVECCYGGTLSRVDFVREAEAARVRINTWVEEQTRHKVQDLIPPGAFDSFGELVTSLVVVSAVYFKGTWAAVFDPDDTRDEPFHVDGRDQSPASMMHYQQWIWHMQANGYQAVNLAYRDSALSMRVLLPDRRDGLRDLEEALSVPMLNDCTSRMGFVQVKVSLPRFRITWGVLDVSDALSSLGMSLAFDESLADLSGINGSRRPSDKGLFISRVWHKAFVEVNEKGTEAAAATAATMVTGAARMPKPRQIPTFRADHPFLFALRDRRSGSIVFLGRVVNPSQES